MRWARTPPALVSPHHRRHREGKNQQWVQKRDFQRAQSNLRVSRSTHVCSEMKNRWASWIRGWKEWTRYTYRWECCSEVHLGQNQKNCGEVGGTHVLEFIAERFRRRSRRICLTIKNWNGNKDRLYMSDKDAGWVSKEFGKNHAHHFEDGVSAPGWQECGYDSSLYACGHLWVTSVLHLLMERRNLRMTWANG